MARSKLELCLDVLEVLAERGVCKVSWVTLGARVNFVTLKPILKILLEKALVEEKYVGEGSMGYDITANGKVILEYLVHFRDHSPVASLAFA